MCGWLVHLNSEWLTHKLIFGTIGSPCLISHLVFRNIFAWAFRSAHTTTTTKILLTPLTLNVISQCGLSCVRGKAFWHYLSPAAYIWIKKVKWKSKDRQSPILTTNHSTATNMKSHMPMQIHSSNVFPPRTRKENLKPYIYKHVNRLC